MGIVPTQGKAMASKRWQCSHCGKHGEGKAHEDGPGFPRGWFSKYISYGDSIYGCTEECFNQAKEKRNVGNKAKSL